MTGNGDHAARSAMVDIAVLGDLHVRRHGRHINLTATESLLLVLLITDGAPVAADTLQRRLWSREPDRRTEQNLRRVIKNLRDKLGGGPPPAGDGASLVEFARLGTRSGYRLNPALVHTDLRSHEEHITAGTAALLGRELDEAAAEFKAALALWGKSPFQETATWSFATSWVSVLRNWHRTAVAGHAEALIRLGRHLEAIPGLYEATAEHPGDGGLWELLIVALYTAGRDPDAAAALHDASVAFHREGIDPGYFRRLQQDVLNLSLPRHGSLALDWLGASKRSAPPDAAA